MPSDLDHLVISVSALDQARARYEALGFTVNADGIHPFGTYNCCIFFENDTYLEPLAIKDQAAYEAAIADKNPFLMTVDDYRKKFDAEGVCCVVFKTKDAASDRERFHSSQFPHRELLAFTRNAKNADGSETILSVKGAYAVNEEEPAVSFFTVEWIGDTQEIAKIRSAPIHANGAIGVTEVSYKGENQSSFDIVDQIQKVTGTAPLSDGSTFRMNEFTLLADRHNTGSVKIDYFKVAVKSLAVVKDIFAQNNVGHDSQSDKIVVPASDGQGATIIFQE